MLLKIFRGISNYNIHRKLRNRYEAKLDWELMTLVNSGLTWLIMWLLTQLLSTKHSPGWGVLFPRWPGTYTITHRSHWFKVDMTSVLCASVHLYSDRGSLFRFSGYQPEISSQHLRQRIPAPCIWVLLHKPELDTQTTVNTISDISNANNSCPRFFFGLISPCRPESLNNSCKIVYKSSCGQRMCNIQLSCANIQNEFADANKQHNSGY